MISGTPTKISQLWENKIMRSSNLLSYKGK